MSSTPQDRADAFIGPMFDKARKAAEEAVADAREAGWSDSRIDRLKDSVFHHAMGEQL